MRKVEIESENPQVALWSPCARFWYPISSGLGFCFPWNKVQRVRWYNKPAYSYSMILSRLPALPVSLVIVLPESWSWAFKGKPSLIVKSLCPSAPAFPDSHTYTDLAFSTCNSLGWCLLSCVMVSTVSFLQAFLPWCKWSWCLMFPSSCSSCCISVSSGLVHFLLLLKSTWNWVISREWGIIWTFDSSH